MKTLNVGKDVKKIFCMILISFVVTFLFYFFLAKSMNMWDNEVAGYIFYGMFQFAIILFAFKEQLRYADKVMNMIIIYGISLICTGISIKVNSNIVEPLLWIPVIYALYTDYKIAMISGVLSVSMKYLFNMDNSELYIIYYIVCIGACVFVPYITDYKIMIISAVAYVFMSILATVIVEFIFNEQIFMWVVKNIIVNVLINVIIIIASRTICVYNSPSKKLNRELKSLLANDNQLLIRFKDYSMPAYLHGQEVAELASEAAREIGADELLVKCAGVYHEVGRISGGKDIVNETLKVAIDNNFPERLINIMGEYSVKAGKPHSREAAIVMLCDTVITTAEYMLHNKKSFTYEKLTDSIFYQRMSKGYLDEAGLSIDDYNRIKECFIRNFKEK